jgi:hypothetical protein
LIVIREKILEGNTIAFHQSKLALLQKDTGREEKNELIHEKATPGSSVPLVGCVFENRSYNGVGFEHVHTWAGKIRVNYIYRRQIKKPMTKTIDPIVFRST